jgi:hypothetical protein
MHPTLVLKDRKFNTQPDNAYAAGHKASGSSLSLKQALSKLAVAR